MQTLSNPKNSLISQEQCKSKNHSITIENCIVSKHGNNEDIESHLDKKPLPLLPPEVWMQIMSYSSLNLEDKRNFAKTSHENYNIMKSVDINIDSTYNFLCSDLAKYYIDEWRHSYMQYY